ncbi:MAG: putative glycosyltransferase [Solidesulfovibrio magneticus str. Maddingley MBC34]|uniref:Putative glycosyltransferase n=1 Tax=Solidesulfovibrio magneticus str. Maddingley MBC34 TaxID=1206767 RepID=K6GEI5_9BACT|nr:MAG: putative glycosyltransferase [Solidesulfovibrio magneticus str. Maddingley MBC34]
MEGNMARTLHIAVVTYNRLESTVRCLESVLARTDADFRLTVVDNGSEKDTVAYLLRLHNKKKIDDLYLFERNMGVACGYNFALSVSREPFFVRLDNDLVIRHPAWASVLMNVLSRHQEIGTAGFHVWANCPAETFAGLGDDDVFIPRSFTTGACCMSRRDVHEKLGFWCEDYGLYGEEDKDFGYRLAKAGMTAGYVDKRGKYVLHEHTPYETGGIDALRNDKNRQEALRMRRLNEFLYEKGLRGVFMPRKYDAKLDGLRVRFAENPEYARFMEDVAKIGRKLEPVLAAPGDGKRQRR